MEYHGYKETVIDNNSSAELRGIFEKNRELDSTVFFEDIDELIEMVGDECTDLEVILDFLGNYQ